MATALQPQATPLPIPAPYSQPGARYGVLPAAVGHPAPQITLRMAPEWRARARALCDKASLTGTPHHHCWHEGPQHETWQVPTRDRYGPDHVVRLDCRRGVMVCNCTAGSMRTACCHIGAVLYWMVSYDEGQRPRTPREEADDIHWSSYCDWAAENAWMW